MILPNVRASFGRDDAQLLVRALGRDDPDRERHWESIVSERGIDPLLDDPATLEAIMEGPNISTFPLRMVLYVLLRQSLLAGGVESRLLSDYLASLVLRFGEGKRFTRIRDYDDGEYYYLVDILEDMREASGPRAFLLRAHMGNFALWLSGLFPDYIASRMHRAGGPDLGYYEEMGQTGFLLASEDPYARGQALAELYRDAAEAFVPMRRALNRFSDRYLVPLAASPVDRLLRQVRDDFEENWLQA
jgi:hypothetical protein